MVAIEQFFTMGGYAGYIWPSYGVTAVLLVAMLIASQRMLRSNEATYMTLESARQRNNKDGTVEKKT